jgi:hypothetical protein
MMAQWATSWHFFREEGARDGVQGWLRWWHDSDRFPERQQGLEQLLQDTAEGRLTFDKVHQLFQSCPCAESDQVVAEWFLKAHMEIERFLGQPPSPLRPRDLRPLLNELKYMVEAQEFYDRWGLQPLLEEINMLYQTLLDTVSELKAQQQTQLELEKKKAAVEEKRLELEKIREQKAAILAQKEKIALQKEKTIEERKLREAKAEEHREAQKLMEMEARHAEKIAEERRRTELESSLEDIARQWDSQLSDKES